MALIFFLYFCIYVVVLPFLGFFCFWIYKDGLKSALFASLPLFMYLLLVAFFWFEILREFELYAAAVLLTDLAMLLYWRNLKKAELEVGKFPMITITFILYFIAVLGVKYDLLQKLFFRG